MNNTDVTRFAFTALNGARKRTLLMLLAMATGVASVLLLTSLGEAARRYVIGEFASLGTNLVIVLPGKSETSGGAAQMMMGDTPRELTLNDAMALTRSSDVRRIAPLNVGSASVSWSGLEREVPILGTSSEMIAIRHWEMARGQFLPAGDIDRANPVCVLGTKLKNELFGIQSALGEWVRIGDRRFRVIGVMASEGQSIGVSVEDVVIIPVASAQQLFNTSSLFRIFIEAKSRDVVPNVIDQTIRIIRDRHQGEEDVTVITQDAVMATFDKILQTLTVSVAGIAAISLIVAGILIMNVMLISVSQRTSEIGLLKALGTPDRQIVILFLAEAGLLSTMGAALGIIIGETGSRLIGYFYPLLSMGAPWWAFVAAVGVALITGMLFSLLPARRAAQLDPVQALARR
jgi:putative ABC transport system permease protein